MRKTKRKAEENTSVVIDEDEEARKFIPVVRKSDEPPAKKRKWINKQRVMIFASRGITFRDRHLMQNLRTLLPHSKSESKMEKKDSLFVINEICEMKNCNKCIYFENRKQKDLYMWMSGVPHGPSIKFLVENVHTMEELKMTGNCLKGARPLLSFDPSFDSKPHWSLLREVFTQIFGTPRNHPKSQPFIDHVYTFTILDNRVWFRNYQIMEEDGSLVEIGPRFVLNPIRIFEGSFGGKVLFSNPHYVSPNIHRRQLKATTSKRYQNKVEQKKSSEVRKPKVSYKLDPTDDVFNTLPPEKVKGSKKSIFYRSKK